MAFREGNSPIAISDSALIKPVNFLDKCACGIKLRILSSGLVTGYVAKPVGLPTKVQYQAFLNITSTQQTSNPFFNSTKNTPFGTTNSFDLSTNDPYPNQHIQPEPMIVLAGNVVGNKIVMCLAPTTSETDNVGNALQAGYPNKILFTYFTDYSGNNLQLNAQYYSTGEEPQGFVEELIKGFEFTTCPGPGWVVRPNPINIGNSVPVFSTPVELSEMTYNSTLNGTNNDTRTVYLLVEVLAPN